LFVDEAVAEQEEPERQEAAGADFDRAAAGQSVSGMPSEANIRG
jgi:hypothetical protein